MLEIENQQVCNRKVRAVRRTGARQVDARRVADEFHLAVAGEAVVDGTPAVGVILGVAGSLEIFCQHGRTHERRGLHPAHTVDLEGLQIIVEAVLVDKIDFDQRPLRGGGGARRGDVGGGARGGGCPRGRARRGRGACSRRRRRNGWRPRRRGGDGGRGRGDKLRVQAERFGIPRAVRVFRLPELVIDLHGLNDWELLEAGDDLVGNREVPAVGQARAQQVDVRGAADEFHFAETGEAVGNGAPAVGVILGVAGTFEEFSQNICAHEGRGLHPAHTVDLDGREVVVEAILVCKVNPDQRPLGRGGGARRGRVCGRARRGRSPREGGSARGGGCPRGRARRGRSPREGGSARGGGCPRGRARRGRGARSRRRSRNGWRPRRRGGDGSRGRGDKPRVQAGRFGVPRAVRVVRLPELVIDLHGLNDWELLEAGDDLVGNREVPAVGQARAQQVDVRGAADEFHFAETGEAVGNGAPAVGVILGVAGTFEEFSQNICAHEGRGLHPAHTVDLDGREVVVEAILVCKVNPDQRPLGCGGGTRRGRVGGRARRRARARGRRRGGGCARRGRSPREGGGARGGGCPRYCGRARNRRGRSRGPRTRHCGCARDGGGWGLRRREGRGRGERRVCHVDEAHRVGRDLQAGRHARGVLRLVAQADIFVPVPVESVLADVHPAVGHVKTVRENLLVEDDPVAPARVGDVVVRAFGGAVDGRDAHVNRVQPRAGTGGETPRGEAVGGAGARLYVAKTASLRRARQSDVPATRGGFGKTRAAIVHQQAGGDRGRIAQRRAAGQDLRPVIHQRRVLHPERLGLSVAERVCAGAFPAIRVNRTVGGILDQEVQMRPGGVAGVAAEANDFAACEIDTARRGAGLHGHRAHVSVGSGIAVGVAQFNVDAEIGSVVLRIVPTGVDHLVGVRRGVQRTVTDAIILAVVSVVGNPVAEAVTPVQAVAVVAHAILRGRRASRRRRGTVLARQVAVEGGDEFVGVAVVGGGVIENGFLRGAAGEGRVEKSLDRRSRREVGMSRDASRQESARAEGQSAQKEGDKKEAGQRAVQSLHVVTVVFRFPPSSRRTSGRLKSSYVVTTLVV